MVIIHSKEIQSDFKGTIIDIESIGDFCNEYRGTIPEDSRLYQNIIPVIFGYIHENGLKIHCAKNVNSIEILKNNIPQILSRLKKPFYAFNCSFEKAVLYHSCGIIVDINCELQRAKKRYERPESKRDAVSLLGIENYDDPFFDIGYQCMLAWEKGNTELAIKHNRSCLLKERDILLKRGFRKPDELVFQNFT